MRGPNRRKLGVDARLAMGLVPGLVLLFSLRTAAANLSSAATSVAPGDTPLNLIETPDGFLISTNSGYGPQYLQAYDETRQGVSDRLTLSSLWLGLDYTQKLLLASDGNHGVHAVPFENGRFGSPKMIDLADCSMTAGLAIETESTAVVACNQNQKLVQFDFRTGQVLRSASAGEFPYEVRTLPGGRLAVSEWGQAAVEILDGAELKSLQKISVGSHPSDMIVRKDQLLVACADSDLVSVIDLKTLREIRRLDIRIPDSSLGGAQPDALSFDSAARKLFVALAGVNALAVFDLATDEEAEISFEGLLPVGAYPTALLYSTQARKLFIADGRNFVQGPSSPAGAAFGPGLTPGSHQSDSGSALAYIGYLIGGGIEAIREEDFGRLRSQMTSLARQVYGAGRRMVSAQSQGSIEYFSAKSNPQSPIRHVIYVIKENRTYDQVLGDVKEGDGAPDLVLFGEAVTPNQHALARQFVLFDNFYVDGDVSADGHLWSTAASSTDYVNKVWPGVYSTRLKFNFWGPDYDGDEKHDHPIAVPGSGFIWDLARAARVSYRDYGEWCVDDKDDSHTTRCYVGGLKGHYDPYYLDGIGTVTDRRRIEEWEREFRRSEQAGNNLPELTVMHLPNDHTMGTKPGKPTPRAMVADNDAALGRLVDVVSHSRFWPSTVILVLEDDAQDGPDHVDAHRSPLLVISPYVRHHAVEHAHFSTVSVLKTIEQLLGLGSLTYFDDRAPSLLVDFQKEPVLDAYSALSSEVNPDEMNPANAPGAKQSAAWDFSRPDAAPVQALNRVIWQSVKGRDSEPPAPVFSVRSAAESGFGLP
jgi:DNA-binding beta-propeller fold protein YncE